MKLCRLVVLAAIAILSMARCVSAEPITPKLIERVSQSNFPEFVEMLSLPNDSIVPSDIQKNAAWLETAFTKRGFVTEELPSGGKPLVFARYPHEIPGARTILFYIHFDGMPVVPAQWAQKSPWLPVLKRRNPGGGPVPASAFTPSRVSAKSYWDEIDLQKLYQGPVDPEWRLFARSSSDDKGPIMMFLTAFDVLQAAGLDPALNVKVLLDSEEEKNSPTIGDVARSHRDLLKADAIVIVDGPMHPSGKRTIVLGNRGVTLMELTVYGPRNPLHSGHYGNFIPNPAQRLAALLASMKDDDGRVTIPGYYESVHITASERAAMDAVPDDEAAILKRAGVAKPETVGHNLQEALQYPSLNIRGMVSAATGDKGANIIPGKAVAELDLRTTPGASPAHLAGLIEKHILGRGYHLSNGEPTDAERETYDKIASIKLDQGSEASFTSLESPVSKWIKTSLAETFARDGKPGDIVEIRMMGGTVPTDKLTGALDLPFVILPLVNYDNNQHSFDENLRIGHFLDGTRTFTGLLRSPFVQ